MRRFLVTVADDAEGDLAAILLAEVHSVVSVEEYGPDEAVITPGTSTIHIPLSTTNFR